MADERLIPPGIRDASTLALNKLIDRLGSVPLDQLLVYLVDNADSSALPHLAEQFHITGLEGWALCNNDSERRALIKRAIQLHRRKGTPWAVKEGLKSVGFGGATLTERLPALTYNGTESFTGLKVYGADGWARFTVRLDLGENRGVSATETALIRAVVNEWKNERSHLGAITFAASTTDTATIAESATTAAHDAQADVLPWGMRYDGSRLYNSGRALAYDGADTYAGAISYAMSVGGSLRYDNAWEAQEMSADVVLSDRQTMQPRYDGLAAYDGILDMGATPPPLYDGKMPVTTWRNYVYDGRRTYGSGKEYSGAKSYNGDISFAAQFEYRGIHVIEEVTL